MHWDMGIIILFVLFILSKIQGDPGGGRLEDQCVPRSLFTAL
jgi:hypothetical protein